MCILLLCSGDGFNKHLVLFQFSSGHSVRNSICSGVAKSSTHLQNLPSRMKTGRVHLCRVAGITVGSMAGLQMTSRSSIVLGVPLRAIRGFTRYKGLLCSIERQLVVKFERMQLVRSLTSTHL